VLFRIAKATSTRRDAFRAALLRVALAAESLQVVLVVVVAAVYVVNLIRGLAASHAESVKRLASVAVAPQYADAPLCPVSRQARETVRAGPSSSHTRSCQ